MLRHLPDADEAEALDGAPNSVGADDRRGGRAVAGVRPAHGYGESEPLLRAAFIDYLLKHRTDHATDN